MVYSRVIGRVIFYWHNWLNFNCWFYLYLHRLADSYCGFVIYFIQTILVDILVETELNFLATIHVFLL